MEIRLGDGASDAALNLSNVGNYTDGTGTRAEKQVKIFSIGTGHTVNADLASCAGIKADDLFKIFWLCVIPAGTHKDNHLSNDKVEEKDGKHVHERPERSKRCGDHGTGRRLRYDPAFAGKHRRMINRF